VARQRALRQLLALLPLAAAGALPAGAGELLYLSEGNRLRRIDIASIDAGPLRHEIFVERAALDPARGRDLNGMHCALPDGSGRFVTGEDKGQPHPPAGFGVFDARGRQVGKLSAESEGSADPYGCAFDGRGRLFTSDVGDPGRATGQLLLWFPPFDRFPGEPGAYPGTDARSDHYCVLASGIGTAGAVAIDARDRVYFASSSRFAIYRFSPPFPSAPDAAGGCGERGPGGSARASRQEREVFARGPATFSGLAFAPNGNLYAASVATGRIYEYDPGGALVRRILVPSEWLPPFATGHPQGLAVDSQGTLYYADLDLRFGAAMPRPGPDGKLRRIRFDARGEPQAPEVVLAGLAFPDAVSVLPGELGAPQ